MIVALDVGYRPVDGGELGRCAVVAFENWDDAQAVVEVCVDVDNVKPYVSGRLYERELPPLLAGLDRLSDELPDATIDCLLVDGNVRLDNDAKPGLGMYLYRHFGEVIPVIGVAKNAFAELDAVEVLRGTSRKPLFVTAAGIDETEAADLVRSMAGQFRLPSVIQRADRLTRTPNERAMNPT